MTNPGEMKDKFYDDLDITISATNRTNSLSFLVTFMKELVQNTRPVKG